MTNRHPNRKKRQYLENLAALFVASGDLEWYRTISSGEYEHLIARDTRAVDRVTDRTRGYKTTKNSLCGARIRVDFLFPAKTVSRPCPNCLRTLPGLQEGGGE